VSPLASNKNISEIFNNKKTNDDIAYNDSYFKKKTGTLSIAEKISMLAPANNFTNLKEKLNDLKCKNPLILNIAKNSLFKNKEVEREDIKNILETFEVLSDKIYEKLIESHSEGDLSTQAIKHMLRPEIASYVGRFWTPDWTEKNTDETVLLFDNIIQELENREDENFGEGYPTKGNLIKSKLGSYLKITKKINNIFLTTLPNERFFYFGKQKESEVLKQFYSQSEKKLET
jgi:hypothetical protein